MTTITLSIEEYESMLSRISKLEKDKSELERAYHTQVDLSLSKATQFESMKNELKVLRQAAKETKEGLERTLSRMEIRSLSTTE